MLETILIGIVSVCIAGIGYLLKRMKVREEMRELIISALERYVIERAIYAVESWAEKKLKETGEKIASSEKMKKAIEEVRNIKANLEKWGIKLDISLDEPALKQKIQAIFEEIKEKVHHL